MPKNKYQQVSKQAKVIEGDLSPGDILIKYNANTAVNRIIAFGQLIFGGGKDSNKVHAALYLGDGFVAESQAEGTVKNKLQDLLNQGFRYQVFRCTDKTSRDKAVGYALVHVEKNTRYDFRNLVPGVMGTGKKDLSPDSDQRPLTGPEKLYCSALVTACYNEPALAKESTVQIPLDLANATPQQLAGYLKSQQENFDQLGTISK